MPQRIRVRTIGTCVIHIGDHELTPTTDRLFCLALILTSHRGATYTREQLGDFLWDEPAQSRDPHSMRQLLYRLRTLGFPLREGRGSMISVDETMWDASASSDFTMERYWAELANLPPKFFTFVPGYRAESASMSRWIEQQRLDVTNLLRREMHAALMVADARCDWRQMEVLSRHLLALDTCNEDAVEALAMSLVMLGNKAEALAVLERFDEDLEHPDQWLAKSVARLKKRVQAVEEPIDDFGRPLPPMVGREELRRELHQLIKELPRQQAGQVVVIEGARGMGKTRLAGELHRLSTAQGCRTLAIEGASLIAGSPNHAVGQWARHCAGAAGADPTTHVTLTLMASNGKKVSGRAMTSALADVLGAVSAERPIVLIVDDASAVDSRDFSALIHAAGVARGPVLLLLFVVDEGFLPTISARDPLPRVLRMPELSADESSDLLDQVASLNHSASCLPNEIRSRILRESSGNPRTLVDLSRKLALGLQTNSVPSLSHPNVHFLRPRIRSTRTAANETTFRVLLRSTARQLRAGKLDSAAECAITLEALSTFARRRLLALPLIAEVSARLGDTRAREGAIHEFVSIAGDPDTCIPLAARAYARMLDESSFIGGVSRGFSPTDVALVLALRADLPEKHRLRMAVKHIKLSEFRPGASPPLEAYGILQKITPLNNDDRITLLEGRLVFESYYGSIARSVDLARQLRSMAHFTLRPRMYARMLNNAGSALLRGGEISEARDCFRRSLEAWHRQADLVSLQLSAHRLASFESVHGSADAAFAALRAGGLHRVRVNQDGSTDLLRASVSSIAAQIGAHELSAASSQPTNMTAVLDPSAAFTHVMIASVNYHRESLSGAPVSTDDVLALAGRVVSLGRFRAFDGSATLVSRTLARLGEVAGRSAFLTAYIAARSCSERALGRGLLREMEQ
ncbi:MAG: AAA family ATPase [Gemmatimonadaceae bacterium]|nr:AAA family ATPase [Gemmatimonadaceae bacterium]